MVTDTPTGFKHAFVTGATGIVGSRLCERLIEIGVPVTAYSRTATRYAQPQGVIRVSGDICDVETLMTASKGADVIFHLAGAVHGSRRTIEEYRDVNVSGTQSVVEIAQSIGAKLIHVSTVNAASSSDGVATLSIMMGALPIFITSILTSVGLTVVSWIVSISEFFFVAISKKV